MSLLFCGLQNVLRGLRRCHSRSQQMHGSTQRVQRVIQRRVRVALLQTLDNDQLRFRQLPLIDRHLIERFSQCS